MNYSKLLTVTAVFLLLLLLINGEKTEVNSVEGVKIGRKKICKYKSKKFWGLCLSDIRCTDVCKSEGFQGGDCQGLRRRCYCYNHC
ncbi:hypothetical protein CDL12_25831 [Handroanthus impetiginosus]|uniref:Knottins-like domain-containing protein n=1 Tax=Handroanthus impetiginosus TaxID=429701 RepID=A0A2G9G8P9_9LAMI|nr:hypothetical protein CDL12_25831 [Handroanthus impetiginosus]